MPGEMISGKPATPYTVALVVVDYDCGRLVSRECVMSDGSCNRREIPGPAA